LLKYLAEENPERPLAGVFLVATPYWDAEDWEVDEYALPEDFASKLPEGVPMFFYHGREDEVVPFGHLALYKEKFPWATFAGSMAWGTSSTATSPESPGTSRRPRAQPRAAAGRAASRPN
jgi:pimeloyl-ACP methyl ester carboxylesterase